MKHDPYEVLGVARDATSADIKKAYRKLAAKHHPDVNGTGENEAFNSINASYRVLMNEEARAIFDATGVIMSATEDELRRSTMKMFKFAFDSALEEVFAKQQALDTIDLLPMMKERLDFGRNSVAERVDYLTRSVSDLTAMKTDISRDDGEENLILSSIDEHIDKLQAELVNQVEAHKVISLAFDEVCKFKSVAEAMRAMEKERRIREMNATNVSLNSSSASWIRL